MALDIIAELYRVIEALEAAGIEYALCGGLALAVHGHPRATDDIDILIDSNDIDRVLDVARNTGFDIPARQMIFGLRDGHRREVRRVSKLDPTTGDLMALDFLVTNDELASVWHTRERAASGDRTISVVSREGLATMKRLAGRPRDLADIAALEGTDEEDT